MRIEICEYKNQTIYYDEDSDKFVCDIELNDNIRSAKRASLSNVKKEIDLFIKANANFKPFSFIGIGYGLSPTVYTAEQIRTDNKIILSRDRSSLKDYETRKGILKIEPKQFDQEVLDNVKKLRDEEIVFRNDIDKKIKDELSKLKPLDISDLIPNLD